MIQHLQVEFWQYVWNAVVFSIAISGVIGGLFGLLGFLKFW
jgi:hypothetical protein